MGAGGGGGGGWAGGGKPTMRKDLQCPRKGLTKCQADPSALSWIVWLMQISFMTDRRACDTQLARIYNRVMLDASRYRLDVLCEALVYAGGERERDTFLNNSHGLLI